MHPKTKLLGIFLEQSQWILFLWNTIAICQCQFLFIKEQHITFFICLELHYIYAVELLWVSSCHQSCYNSTCFSFLLYLEGNKTNMQLGIVTEKLQSTWSNFFFLSLFKKCCGENRNLAWSLINQENISEAFFFFFLLICIKQNKAVHVLKNFTLTYV